MFLNIVTVVLLATSVAGDVRVPLVRSKTINLHLDSRYRARIGVGTPTQDFTCLVHTVAHFTAVAGKDCSRGCEHVEQRFDPKRSSTFRAGSPTHAADPEGRFGASGRNAVDTFRVNNTEVPRQSFVVASALDSGYSEIGADCVLGLDNGRRTIFQNMIDHKMLAKDIMFIHHERHSEQDHHGQILFGALDTSLISGQPTYVPLIDDNSWTVNIDEVSLDGESVCKDCQGYVDTSTAVVHGPRHSIEKLNEKIGCKHSDNNNRCVVDCSRIGSLKPVGFKLAGRIFVLSPQHYIQQEETYCWSGFVTNTQSDSWRWGDFFLDHIYVVFDPVNRRVGFADSSEH